MGEMAGSLAGESPLVPNRTMQRIYEGMVQSRMLGDWQQVQRGKSKAPATFGQEACRASVLIGMGEGDLVSDHAGFRASALLLGGELGEIAAGADQKVTAYAGVPGLLPSPKDVGERLHLACGAALALRRLKLAGVVVVFAEAAEVKPSLWREILRLAAEEELAMLFVALASGKGSKAAKLHEAFVLSDRATAHGVPGIPVDAADAIALYRVAQESIGRARAGGGPALMECISPLALRPLIKKQAGGFEADPVAWMGEMLLRRGVCGEDWIAEVAPAFQAALDTL
jgi:TPP-dependent pyruvate/acetoin dehydrogenase alpha subunit